mmetsp:Transcript_60886/g.132083  ORF Transcript_60886/g.132083 Transcript_60886/m.132083 type:complete len:426 (+) Transcript_60886:91-1368(+)
MVRRTAVLPAVAALAIASTVFSRVLRTFVAGTVRPSLRSQAAPGSRISLHADATAAKVPEVVRRPENWIDPYEVLRADIDDGEDTLMDGRQVSRRNVKVTDQRDLNELLRLSNPLRPGDNVQLIAITMEDGTKIERPTVEDLKKLRVSELRPVTFTWKDTQRVQTKGPKDYDELIKRMLNSSPATMEDLVRANWQQFDQMFFFRLGQLRDDTTDERLKEKLKNMEKYTLELIQVAQETMRKRVPEHAAEAREILNSMQEEDGDTLLWPPTGAAYTRLAQTITKLAVRNKYEDAWFETVLECLERFGLKMQGQQQNIYFNVAQTCMQRIITEWLRHDDLWEETKEGRFIFRLMSITHEQWSTQLRLEQEPLDFNKFRDELKITGETRVIKLPMNSKLQIYCAKYLQGLLEFMSHKDEILGVKAEKS